MLVRDGTVLLGKRANTGYGDGQWHLPSGHLEPGESVVGAAVREAREEVGVGIRPDDLEFAHVMHRAPDRVGLFFVARTWEGEPYNAEPHKCAELAWRPLGELPDDTIGYPAAAIARVLAEEPFALYGWPTGIA
ncbi:NUDIX domain-containing protein [Nonomuraea sp. NEAU-A123]|nr:NUDIX domain-containing protein [Nonomuraea sp. NEAU-A123]